MFQLKLRKRYKRSKRQEALRIGYVYKSYYEGEYHVTEFINVNKHGCQIGKLNLTQKRLNTYYRIIRNR